MFNYARTLPKRDFNLLRILLVFKDKGKEEGKPRGLFSLIQIVLLGVNYWLCHLKDSTFQSVDKGEMKGVLQC